MYVRISLSYLRTSTFPDTSHLTENRRPEAPYVRTITVSFNTFAVDFTSFFVRIRDFEANVCRKYGVTEDG